MLKDLSQLSSGAVWPPEGEVERLRTYDAHKKLFENKFHEVFKDAEAVTRPELKAANLFVLNWFKRLTTLWCGFMLGETPGFSAGEPESDEAKAVTALVKKLKLVELLEQARIDASRYGDALFKLYVEGGQVRCDVQPPAYWFPIVSPTSVTRITAHVLAWETSVNSKPAVRLEIHTSGRIENKLFLLEGRAGHKRTLGREIRVEGLEPREEHGLPTPLVFRVANLQTSDAVYGFDDYDELCSVVREMVGRLAQMGRILDRHADPGMYGPESALEQDPETGRWSFRKAGYISLTREDATPGYLTWDGNITSALDEFNLLQRQLYTLSETSEAAFGVQSQGVAESGSALKRLLIAPLTKSARVRAKFDPVIGELLHAASLLEREFGDREFPELKDVSITWKDGLPDDETESAANIKSHREAGVMSLYAAVKRLNPDWAEADIQAEIGRINEEKSMSEGLAGGGLFGAPGRAGSEGFEDAA